MNLANPQRTYRYFQSFYFFVFFGFGSLFPLLSVYLEKEQGLSHTQIGTIVAMIPLLTIFIQPLWGIMSDYTRRPRRLLTIAVLIAGMLSIVYTYLDGFLLLLLGILSIAMFQSAVVPLSDSLSLSFVQQYKKEYGNIRLFGALGFAVASFVAGRVTDLFSNTTWVFYLFALGLFLSAFMLIPFPKVGQEMKVDFRTGISRLIKQKEFLLFLCSNFLIFGPVLANNYYFGTFILTVGGTLSGVGVAFLIAAGSEAPFMNIAQKVINRFGVIHVLIFCALVSSMRWLVYFFEPSVSVVYATTIVQGVSVGLYIPAALLFVREVAPSDVQATAVGLYSAVGNGMGNAFFTFIGGVLLDWWNVYGMYAFFSGMTLVGVGLTLVVQRMTSPTLLQKEA
ncbi:MFS transporter [Pontibacillus halophilus JSM 076056 = DSM 19796]|uniref:MFS transporter n=1 Tax=Pontibacillus halophilus JSM 076056 = DSM 19796 TaxID=1385510 RepID=A0A0A5GBK3_9BACI|nr:MFS transporter [Pontibacillus halophilus]KGX89424.1 MFS transporter [Pontibacillus halophilus JSM 076056 = DSM 19796]